MPYFTPKVKFGPAGFCMGKSENYVLFETIAAIGLKVGLNIQINKLMKLNEYQKLRSLFDLGQRSLTGQN